MIQIPSDAATDLQIKKINMVKKFNTLHWESLDFKPNGTTKFFFKIVIT